MEESIHKNHRARMRKKFIENGFDGFNDHEILEMLLFYSIPRCDTNELAHKVLNEYKTLSNVFEADVSELCKIDGIGENSAVLISMISHLARVYERSKCERDKVLYNTESIGKYVISLFKGKRNEEFALICLNSNRRVHWSGIISKGSIDQLDASPRILVSEVIKHNAKNVIFAHNHPNGSLTPSSSDKEATKKLVEVLKAIDVVTLDHIIVSDERYYSMAEMGFIF